MTQVSARDDGSFRIMTQLYFSGIDKVQLVAQGARENVDSNQLRFEIAAHIHFIGEVKEV